MKRYSDSMPAGSWARMASTMPVQDCGALTAFGQSSPILRTCERPPDLPLCYCRRPARGFSYRVHPARAGLRLAHKLRALIGRQVVELGHLKLAHAEEMRNSPASPRR